LTKNKGKKKQWKKTKKMANKIDKTKGKKKQWKKIKQASGKKKRIVKPAAKEARNFPAKPKRNPRKDL